MVEKAKKLLSEKVNQLHDLNLRIRIFLVLHLMVIQFLILFFLNYFNNINITVTMINSLVLCFILASF